MCVCGGGGGGGMQALSAVLELYRADGCVCGGGGMQALSAVLELYRADVCGGMRWPGRGRGRGRGRGMGVMRGCMQRKVVYG